VSEDVDVVIDTPWEVKVAPVEVNRQDELDNEKSCRRANELIAVSNPLVHDDRHGQGTRNDPFGDEGHRPVKVPC